MLISQNVSLLMQTRPRQQIEEKWPEREHANKKKMQIYMLLPIETAVNKRSIFHTNKIPL